MMTLLSSLAKRFGQAKAIGHAAMGSGGPQQTPMSAAAPMTPAAPAGGTEMQAQPGMLGRVAGTIGSMMAQPAQQGGAAANEALAYGKLPEPEPMPFDVAAEDEPLPAPGLIRTTPPRRTDTLAKYQQILRGR